MWAVGVLDRCPSSPAFGPLTTGALFDHRRGEERSIGARLGKLVRDLSARRIDVASCRCLAPRDLGAASGRARDAYEGASNEQYGEANRGKNSAVGPTARRMPKRARM